MTFINEKSNDIIELNENDSPLLYGLGINFLKYNIIRLKQIGFVLIGNYVISIALIITVYFTGYGKSNPIVIGIMIALLLILLICYSFAGEKRVVSFLIYNGYKIKVSTFEEKERIAAKYGLTDYFFIF